MMNEKDELQTDKFVREQNNCEVKLKVVTSTVDEKTKQIRRKRVAELFRKSETKDDDKGQKSIIDNISSTSCRNINKNMDSCGDKEFFNIVYGKKTTKKHKTYDDDGTLEVSDQTAVLKDADGKILGRTSAKSITVTEGLSLSVGNFLVEVLGKTVRKETVNKTDSQNEDAEPPKKKFKQQQFIPLRPSGVTSKPAYNRLSVLKEKSTLNFNSSKKNPENNVSSKVKTVLHLFDKKMSEDKDSVEVTETNKSNEKNTPNCEPSVTQKITYNVVYGKITAKKHKTYDEDGLLEIENKSVILKNTAGSVVGRGIVKLESVFEGAKICIGGKEVEVLDKVSCDKITVESKTVPKLGFSKLLKKPLIQQFLPLRSSGKSSLLTYEPLIMPPVKKEIEWDEDDSEPKQVSVDACLASVLRPHQRTGLTFLYKCVMGINKSECEGAILADEMGLGKTLQCITLLWTLLKQGPFGKPVINRVLIVAPSSLCGNWKKEFIHWLGSHRITPYIVNEKNKAKDFAKLPRANVMIISYEMFVRNFDDVNKHNFSMVVCDEGHRLKNAEVKALKLLSQLKTRKRILLTGTPVQNDLQELYTLSDFVNPGIFEDRSYFRKHYENPIVASQLPDADEDILELGKERATELHECTKLFILRRTNDVINKYLPQKHELVVFCRFTELQQTLYEAITNDWMNRSEISHSGMAFPLTVINNLKKICNHPNLIQNDKDLLENLVIKKALSGLNGKDFCEHSGKIIVLTSLLRELKDTKEKVVLISYFTQTLDILERVCSREGFQFCRLDGSTAANSRTQIVEKFNSNSHLDCRVFLLSAKAGGVGLNLPGASRLVLFDSDWNPANDAQAMARIWREGQKRTVYIYRFLTTGTIEEKIYQRQISKTGLSEAVVDLNHVSSMKLSMSELKDLFTLVQDTNSITHDLMECSCETDSDELKENELTENESQEDSRSCQLNLQDDDNNQHLTINQLLRWKHYKPPIDDKLLEDLLIQQDADYITFVFKNSSQPELIK